MSVPHGKFIEFEDQPFLIRHADGKVYRLTQQDRLISTDDRNTVKALLANGRLITEAEAIVLARAHSLKERWPKRRAMGPAVNGETAPVESLRFMNGTLAVVFIFGAALFLATAVDSGLSVFAEILIILAVLPAVTFGVVGAAMVALAVGYPAWVLLNRIEANRRRS